MKKLKPLLSILIVLLVDAALLFIAMMIDTSLNSKLVNADYMKPQFTMLTAILLFFITLIVVIVSIVKTVKNFKNKE